MEVLDSQAHQDHQEVPGYLDFLALEVKQDLKVQQAHQVLLVLLDLRDHLASQEEQDHQVYSHPMCYP